MIKQPAAPESEFSELLIIFAYLFTWISGLIVYYTAGKTNKRMRFHSVQAIILGIAIWIVAILPQPIGILWALMWVYGLYVGIQAHAGKDIEVPVLGELARQYSN